MTYQNIALIVLIIGALLYIVAKYVNELDRVGELGKWAFIVGLAAWFILAK